MPDKDDRIFVSFWGTRGSISTPGFKTEKYGGNTSCVLLQHQGSHLILDAGTGIRDLGIDMVENNVSEDKNTDIHLLLSHTHWDHIQGLPFFAPAYKKGTNILIYGSPNKEKFLDAILQGQMDVNYFPIGMNALAADISIIEFPSKTTKIDSMEVAWQEQICHPGGSVRYSISANNKKIVYATDVELDQIFNSDNTKMKKLGDEYLEFIKDADLLIADGQYTAKEYSDRVGFGHTSIPLAIETAYKQGVKQLAIFHHEPQHSDNIIDALWNKYGPKYAKLNPSMNIFWAREGMTLALS